MNSVCHILLLENKDKTFEHTYTHIDKVGI